MRYDCLIIGAGSAGITASIYLKRANLNCAIIEKGTPGGALNTTSKIENYPGYSKISGPDLAMKFYQNIKDYNVPYIYGEVTEIIDKNEYKIVKTKDNEYETKAIIIAVGRSPKNYNEESKQLVGKGISFCALCDGALYKNLDVAVIGAGNTSLEESLYLSDICKKVYIINRTDKIRGDKMLLDKINKKENIEILLSSSVTNFNKQEDILSSLTINENGNEKQIDVKACFIFIGYEPATNFLNTLEILDEKGYIITDDERRTNLPYIYAAGDIVKKSAYQIVTATSDGAIAAVSCIADLK